MTKGTRNKSFKIHKGMEISNETDSSKHMYFGSDLIPANSKIIGGPLDESLTSQEYRKKLDILIAAAKDMISRGKC